MRNRFCLVSGLLSCALSATAIAQENQLSTLPRGEATPPVHFHQVEWGKAYDPAIAVDRQSRLRMRQYNALIPWYRELSTLVSQQRMDLLRLRQLQAKMARLRTQISADMDGKRKCLQTEIYLLQTTEELLTMQLEQPASPRDGFGMAPIPIDVEQLGSVIMGRVEREEELAQLESQLKPCGK